MFLNIERFEFGQRVAKMFAESQLVPQALRGKVADCLIALDMAERMGEDPIMVMQNIFFVHGRAGWAAQYMIARANRSGHFAGPLRWRTTGAGTDLAVTCFADLADIAPGSGPGQADDRRVEITVSMAMARADGWTQNEKYKSIPEQMLRWRSATWLIRLYSPEVMMGLPALDELEDKMVDVTPARPRPRLEEYAAPVAEATGEDATKPAADATPPPLSRELAPGLNRGQARGRGRPRTEPPLAPSAAEPAVEEKSYSFTDHLGEVHEFTDFETAVAAYADLLAAVDSAAALEAAWENGEALRASLRAADHGSAVDALVRHYSELRTAFEPEEDAPEDAPEDASNHGPQFKPGAGSGREQGEEAKSTVASAAYDVVVPMTGISAQAWFQPARQKLREMDGRPPVDFRRYREANATPLALLKKTMSSWYGILDKAISAGEAGPG
jgi:hypothetical protein